MLGPVLELAPGADRPCRHYQGGVTAAQKGRTVTLPDWMAPRRIYGGFFLKTESIFAFPLVVKYPVSISPQNRGISCPWISTSSASPYGSRSCRSTLRKN